MSDRARLDRVGSVIEALRLRAESRHAELRRRIAALEAHRATLLRPPPGDDPAARAQWDRWADAALRAVARDRATAEADRIEAEAELRRALARIMAVKAIRTEQEKERRRRQARRAEENGGYMS